MKSDKATGKANSELRKTIAKLRTDLARKNREIEVEAALERVRARTMAMQRSDELKDVIQKVYDQFVYLKVNVEHTGFILDYKERDDMFIWLADKHKVPAQITIPYFDSPHWNSFVEAKATGKPFFTNLLPFEEKNKFYKDLFELVPGVDAETSAYYLSCPGLAISTVLLENVVLYIENFAAIPFTDEENAILMRFGKVFQQTYTRFLDLQKAEAQTREAQIEAALEKVRTVALSLKKSEDMLDIARVLYEQLVHLGFTNIRNALIDIHNEKSESFTDYDYSELMGGTVTEMTYEDDPTLKEQVQDIATTTDGYSEMVLEGQQLQDLIDMRRKNGEADDPRLLAAKNVSYILYAFGNGAIGISNFGKLDENQKVILARFRKVFTFAYNRYTELSKAEAQMREVQLEASLEKVRSVALGMQKPDDMLDVAQALYEQLRDLGFSDIRNTIIDLHNEDDETFWDYDYSEAMSGSITLLSYKNDPTLEEQYRKIISTTNGFYEEIFEGEALKEYVEMRIRNGEKDDPRLRNVDLLSYYLYSFGNGVIGISNFSILNENQKEIVGRFRNVFTFAYKRYTDLLQSEKDLIELQEAKRAAENAFTELKATQKQLIQSEKMASLGELTAGIAHEIQNPLNFVNNFSEVSSEMMDEMKQELATGNQQEAMEIADDIKQNLEKINHHGKRADSIVKGMLEHSRSSTGTKEPTDINALADEYLRLAYHGLRAKNKSFNADIKTDFDESVGKIDVIPQDIGRVLLNLFNNAFYAVAERGRSACAERSAAQSSPKGRGAKDLPGFQNLAGLQAFNPTVSVTTKKKADNIEIRVSDNGNGIPKEIVDKIFQPFFTTKPTGQGTGLGLSLSYDIIKAHSGDLKVETEPGKGTSFIVQLKTKN